LLHNATNVFVFPHSISGEELEVNMTLQEKYTLDQLDAFDPPVLAFMYLSRICNLTDYI
jgi:hypothetical protein